MQLTRLACLTGTAAILLACYAGMAKAGTPDTHVMTVRFPDGQVGQITYVGDTPPAVVFAPAAMPFAVQAASPFAVQEASQFAAMDRMMAAMDRQAAVMFRAMDAAMASPGGFGTEPVAAGPGVCMRSIQVTFTGQGQPHVVSQTSGDCGSGGAPTPALLPAAPASKPVPRIIQARAESAPRPNL